MLVERRGIPRSERIYYLKKYLAGPAKEAVEGYFFLTTDDAFDEAKQLLEERYGDPFIVARAFRDKLENWPKITTRDGNGLRKFADFLRQCESASRTISSLNVLNDDQENRNMLTKLPDWLVTRWGHVVPSWKDQHRTFPPFSVFVKFIVKEANIACDPITSLPQFKNVRTNETERPARYGKVGQKRSVGSSSFSTDAKETSTNQKREQTLCSLCQKPHHVDECRTFLSKPMLDRKEFAKAKGLCFGCLDTGHKSKFCKQRRTCKTCNKQHPTSLHGDYRNRHQSENENSGQQPSVCHLSGADDGGKCSMTVPVWLSHKDQPETEVLVYALLDTQSDTTFILQDTLDTLGVSGPNVKLRLATMYAENRTVDSRRIKGLRVRGYDSYTTIDLPVSYSRDVMPANRQHIPTPEMARQWPHLEGIADKLMPLNDGAEVGILIGYNCSRALAPREVIPLVHDEPYAQCTDLGWGIVGIVEATQDEADDDVIGVSHRVLTLEVPQLSTVIGKEHPSSVTFSLRTTVKEIITPLEVTRMLDLDFNEHKSNNESLSQDDRTFLNRMNEGIHLTTDNHYEMPLPFRVSAPNLPCNKVMAVHRLNHLKKRMMVDNKYHEDYTSFMENIIQNGYAEKVPTSELPNESGTWYIPHHGIYHAKKPGKIRIVFDCSAKFKGQSLNDHLLQGPDLTNTLVGVLTRFREEPVALICDIEQMFFQFRVNAEHRDYLRFLWWDNGDYNTTPIEYRMKVHLFGAASSPGCSNFGLKQAATDNESEFGSEAANFIRGDFYVDDGLKSLPDETQAINLIDQPWSRYLCYLLQGWSTSSQIPVEFKESYRIHSHRGPSQRD